MTVLRTWIERNQRGDWLTLPPEHLNKHGLVIGAPGSGKTETLLRIAALVRKYYGWQVIYVDLKGDPATQTRFVAAMRQVPKTRVRTFPASHYDGWRGDGNAIFNRLLGIQDYSEAYYKSIAVKMLRLAISSPLGVPRNSRELLARLDLDTLRTIYQNQPEIVQLASMDRRLASGVSDRYWGFFASLDGKLDGDLAYEDADAIYLLVEGLALREEAKSLGRFLVEDFIHYVPARKKPSTMVLFLVDEISTLDLNAEGFSAFEKARSYGASIIASAQTYEGLGRYRDRISGASHLILLHRCNDPDELVERAGRQQQVQANWGVELGGATGRGSMSLRPQLRVDPDEVRALRAGEVFVICQGSAQKARVAQQSTTAEQEQDAQRDIAAEMQQRQAHTITQQQTLPNSQAQSASGVPADGKKVAETPVSAKPTVSQGPELI